MSQLPLEIESAKLVYTVREFAEMLSVSRSTVTDWCARGLIPCYRTPGGYYRIKREALEALTHKPPT